MTLHIFPLREMVKRGEFELLDRIYPLLMDENEQEMVKFVKDYKGTFGTYPSVERMEDEFPLFKLIRDVNYPIADIVTEWIKNSKTKTVKKFLSKQIDEETIDNEETYEFLGEIKDVGLVELQSSKTVKIEDYLVHSGASFPTGIRAIDNEIIGLLPGEVFALIGRPNVGKTIFMIWLAYKWVMRGARVLFVSCEMPNQLIWQRFASLHSKYDPKIWRSYKLLPLIEQLKLVASKEKFTNDCVGEILMPKKNVYTIPSLLTAIDQAQPDVVIIEAFYRMRPVRENIGDDFARVRSLIFDVTETSIAKQVPIFISSQFSRSAANDKSPQLEKIAFSDAIGMDSSFILSLITDEEDENAYQASLIKTRAGGKGVTVSLERNPSTLEFTELP